MRPISPENINYGSADFLNGSRVRSRVTDIFNFRPFEIHTKPLPCVFCVYRALSDDSCPPFSDQKRTTRTFYLISTAESMNGVKLVENTSKHFQLCEPSGRLNGNKHFPSEFTRKLVPTSDFAFWGEKAFYGHVYSTDSFGRPPGPAYRLMLKTHGLHRTPNHTYTTLTCTPMKPKS